MVKIIFIEHFVGDKYWSVKTGWHDTVCMDDGTMCSCLNTDSGI